MGIHHVTVVRDFGSYTRGQHIEDDAEIERILAGEMRNHVVKVLADAKPAEMQSLSSSGESGNVTLKAAELPRGAESKASA